MRLSKCWQIDRHNHHTFLPLLYEVATAGLTAEDVAQPVRAILRGARNARFLLDRVTRVDLEARRVITEAGRVSYDYLVVAAGTVTNYFGMASVERHALGLKDLSDANAIRGRIVRNFERAAAERDGSARARLMTMLSFRYRDRGTMATIGRRIAVAHVFGLQVSGSLAWVLWLVVHLLSIIGLRNRALVLLNWAWNYFRYDSASRVVTDEGSGGKA